MKPRTALYLLLPLSLVLAVAATGCAVTPYGYYSARVYTESPPVEFGYTPMLYEGYVVYYDDASLPIYWVNGVQFDVPVAYRQVYIEDYHQHRDAYLQWDIQRGERYRGQHYDRKDHEGSQGHEEGQGRQPERSEDRGHQVAPAPPQRERPQPQVQERARPQPQVQQEHERQPPQVEQERGRQQPAGPPEDPRKKRDKDKKKPVSR